MIPFECPLMRNCVIVIEVGEVRNIVSCWDYLETCD